MNEPRFASFLSTQADSDAAIAEAVRGIHAGLNGAKPDLVACFVSHHHGPAIETLGPRLASALGARVLIGCTGESIVGNSREIERGAALSVWAGVLPNTTVRPFTVSAESATEETIRFTGVPQVRDRERSSLLVFADPFSFPTAEFLELLNDKMPGVLAVGGMASGGQGPGQNLLITEEGPVEGGAIGVVIEGDVEVRSVVSQGCRPVGKPFVITACRENFILKLGGKQALQALMDTMQSLPSKDQTLMQRGPFIGLALDATKSSFERSDFLVRGIIGLEKNLHAIAVSDDSIRNGMTVQFLVRDAASAGEDLVHSMRERLGDAPVDPHSVGALVFSCNGRGSRMFEKPDHDIGCVQSAFEAEIPAAGFFAMGEIGPVGGRNFLHGFTASVAVFRRRP
jgi:small ligand-binding sensory domain FIST